MTAPETNGPRLSPRTGRSIIPHDGGGHRSVDGTALYRHRRRTILRHSNAVRDLLAGLHRATPEELTDRVLLAASEIRQAENELLRGPLVESAR